MNYTYLAHTSKGYQRPNHKYIKRHMTDKGWVYTYEKSANALKNKFDKFVDYNITGRGYERDLAKEASDNAEAYLKTFSNPNIAKMRQEQEELAKKHQQFLEEHKNKSIGKFISDIPEKVSDAYDDLRWTAMDNARDLVRKGRKKVANILRGLASKSLSVADNIDYKEPKGSWTAGFEKAMSKSK